MFIRSNFVRKSQLSEILTELLNPHAMVAQEKVQEMPRIYKRKTYINRGAKLSKT